MSQTWQTIEGSIYGNAELSDTNRIQAHKLTTLLDAVVPAKEFMLGKKSGDKVGGRINARIPGTSDTPLAETQRVPYTTPPVYHFSAQVFRYAQAIPWTGTRADLDRLGVEDVNIRLLRDHASRTQNKIIHTTLVNGRSHTYAATGSASTPNSYYPR